MGRLATLAALALALPGCRLPYVGGAAAIEARTLGPDWVRAAPTPIVRQEARMDCGLAALAIAAGAWGRTWSVAELARDLPPTGTGIKLGALRDLARGRGLRAFAVRGRVADLVHELGRGRPVILGLVLPFALDENLHHYEVAVAVRPSDGAVITRDPATGELMQRSQRILDLEWRHAGYAMLVIVGPRSEHAAVPARDALR